MVSCLMMTGEYCDTALEPVRQSLARRGVLHVSSDWLAACWQYVSDAAPPGTPSHELHALVFAQWLEADLAQLECPALPAACSEYAASASSSPAPAFTLPDVYAVQVQSACDIGRSTYSQFCRLTRVDNNAEVGGEDGEGPITQQQQQQRWQGGKNGGDGARTLWLQLTDGVRCVAALEYRPLTCLPDTSALRPGFKAVLRGPIECRRSTLLLTDENFMPLGGGVDNLSSVNGDASLLAERLRRLAGDEHRLLARQPSDTPADSGVWTANSVLQLQPSSSEWPRDNDDGSGGVSESADPFADGLDDELLMASADVVDVASASQTLRSHNTQTLAAQADVPPAVFDARQLSPAKQSRPVKQSRLDSFVMRCVEESDQSSVACDAVSLHSTVETGCAAGPHSTVRSPPASPPCLEDVSDELEEICARHSLNQPTLAAVELVDVTQPRVQWPWPQAPLAYLSQLAVSARACVGVRAFILTQTSRLSSSSLAQWRLTARISDGSSSMHVRLSDAVLTELIGHSVAEVTAWKKRAQQDPQARVQLRSSLEAAQQRLIHLDCLMRVRAATGGGGDGEGDMATVEEVRQLTPPLLHAWTSGLQRTPDTQQC